jgi:hypothetical protein
MKKITLVLFDGVQVVAVSKSVCSSFERKYSEKYNPLSPHSRLRQRKAVENKPLMDHRLLSGI